MPSAYLQWRFHSGERVVARGPLVHISAQNIDFGYPLEPLRRGGSSMYQQSMFLSRNKENNVYPSKLQFNYILEMCQYDSDATAQSHPHPHADILLKKNV